MFTKHEEIGKKISACHFCQQRALDRDDKVIYYKDKVIRDSGVLWYGDFGHNNIFNNSLLF